MVRSGMMKTFKTSNPLNTEFPSIAFNNEVSSEKTLSYEPTVSSLNDEIDFRVSFDDSDDEDYTAIFDKNSFSYKKISTNDLKTDLENDNEKVTLSLPSPELVIMSKYDEEEQNVLYFNDLFPFNIIHPDDLESEKDNDDMALPPRDQRHQYLRYEGLQYTDADIADFEMRLARIYKREVHRIGISSVGDFLGTAPSYTAIQDPILRLCHRLIACSIAGRSQAPEKVTVTNLFYLRGMDVGSVNVPYLLARLLTAEILEGLTVIAPALPVIDMAELVRVAQDALIIDEGGQADPAPVQAPPPPPLAPAKTMP
ncbi:hypothetical protein Tco_0740198 [Tanacetum coccineum]